MRTTLTLDSDLAASLRHMARERDVSFRQLVNDVLRAGLMAEGLQARPFRQATYRMGLRPGVDLTKALRLAAEMEDEETARQLELRK